MTFSNALVISRGHSSPGTDVTGNNNKSLASTGMQSSTVTLRHDPCIVKRDGEKNKPIIIYTVQGIQYQSKFDVQSILSKMSRIIFIIFSDTVHIHVLMLCRKFKLILIKIGFFMNFQSCSKIGPNTLYYSTWSSAKFCQKWLGENS